MIKPVKVGRVAGRRRRRWETLKKLPSVSCYLAEMEMLQRKIGSKEQKNNFFIVTTFLHLREIELWNPQIIGHVRNDEHATRKPFDQSDGYYGNGGKIKFYHRSLG